MSYLQSKLFTLPLCEGEMEGWDSFSTLISWLAHQPGNKEYCYFADGACLFAQYLTAHGKSVIGVGGNYFRDGNNTCHSFPPGFASVASLHPHTFGAALSRARRALRESER